MRTMTLAIILNAIVTNNPAIKRASVEQPPVLLPRVTVYVTQVLKGAHETGLSVIIHRASTLNFPPFFMIIGLGVSRLRAMFATWKSRRLCGDGNRWVIWIQLRLGYVRRCNILKHAGIIFIFIYFFSNTCHFS